MTNADLYYQYIFGWTAGAGRKAISQERAQHKDEAMREAYAEGFSDGQEANNEAAARASEKYGYKPSIIRTA